MTTHSMQAQLKPWQLYHPTHLCFKHLATFPLSKRQRKADNNPSVVILMSNVADRLFFVAHLSSVKHMCYEREKLEGKIHVKVIWTEMNPFKTNRLLIDW